MPIIVNLDVVLAKRKMKLKDLANAVGIATDCNEALEQIQRITIFLDRLRSLGKNRS